MSSSPESIAFHKNLVPETSMQTYEDCFGVQIKAVNNMLDEVLSTAVYPAVRQYPKLLECLRYGTLNGGKRIRAVLAIESYVALGGLPETIMPVACALELLHAQSLIHDDLPCMDDDDLRRGKPSLHKAFGEASAVLAGDALIAIAFGVLTQYLQPSSKCGATRILSIINDFSRVASLEGLINGQYADLDAEGKPCDEKTLVYVQQYKTGALFRFAMQSAAKLSGASDTTISEFATLGEQLGLVFQMVDDLLDIDSNEAVLGKTVGKDVVQKKATYPALYGAAKAREKLNRLYCDICDTLYHSKSNKFETCDTRKLLLLASFVAHRAQ